MMEQSSVRLHTALSSAGLPARAVHTMDQSIKPNSVVSFAGFVKCAGLEMKML